MFMLGSEEQSGGVGKEEKMNEWEASADIMRSNEGKEVEMMNQSGRHKPGYHNVLPVVT